MKSVFLYRYKTAEEKYKVENYTQAAYYYTETLKILKLPLNVSSFKDQKIASSPVIFTLYNNLVSSLIQSSSIVGK